RPTSHYELRFDDLPRRRVVLDVLPRPLRLAAHAAHDRVRQADGNGRVGLLARAEALDPVRPVRHGRPASPALPPELREPTLSESLGDSRDSDWHPILFTRVSDSSFRRPHIQGW